LIWELIEAVWRAESRFFCDEDALIYWVGQEQVAALLASWLNLKIAVLAFISLLGSWLAYEAATTNSHSNSSRSLLRNIFRIFYWQFLPSSVRAGFTVWQF